MKKSKTQKRGTSFSKLKKTRVYFTHSKKHGNKKRGKTAKTAKRGKMTKRGGGPLNFLFNIKRSPPVTTDTSDPAPTTTPATTDTSDPAPTTTSSPVATALTTEKKYGRNDSVIHYAPPTEETLRKNYQNNLGIDQKIINEILKTSFKSNDKNLNLKNCYLLGTGSFGKAYNNYDYALKIIKEPYDLKKSNDYFDELVVVKMIQEYWKITKEDLNIMNIQNWMLISNKLCFVMDKYDFSLYDLFESVVETFNDKNQKGGTISINDDNEITDDKSKCDETIKSQKTELKQQILTHCFTPLNIYNGTDKAVTGEIQGQLLPINELKGNIINLEKYLKLFDTIMKQVATGLKQIHESGFIHFDIKPENIMINGLLNDENDFDEYLNEIHVYIIDFGLAQYIGDNTNINLSKIGGSLPYLPYESFDKTNNYYTLSKKVDIYSFGKLYYDIFKIIYYFKTSSKTKKFDQLLNFFNEVEKTEKLKEYIEKLKLKLNENYYSNTMKNMKTTFDFQIIIGTLKDKQFDNTIVNTIANCLDMNPNKRPTAKELETAFT